MALTRPPRLIALDADDLAVVSTHVQDALVRVGDIVWRQSEKRLVIGLNRLNRDAVVAAPRQPDAPQQAPSEQPRRLISALRFERVLACKSRNIDLDAPETMLELMGVEFHEDDAPSGNAVLLFANGGALRLDVECLECELADLGEDDLGASGVDEDAEPGVGV
jgi:hypothetical protein